MKIWEVIILISLYILSNFRSYSIGRLHGIEDEHKIIEEVLDDLEVKMNGH